MVGLFKSRFVPMQHINELLYVGEYERSPVGGRHDDECVMRKE